MEELLLEGTVPRGSSSNVDVDDVLELLITAGIVILDTGTRRLVSSKNVQGVYVHCDRSGIQI
jgi:hypothetical protein